MPIELSISRTEVDGQVIFVAVINDLSERIAAERERLARLFQDAVESLSGGFSIIDADGILVACNSALTRNMKLEPENLIGRPREVLIAEVLKRMRRFDGVEVDESPDWPARVARRIDAAGDRGIEVEFEGGRWVLLSSQPTSDGGQVTMATEITQLKSAELELRQSEQRFRALVEENPLPLFLVDLETAEILYASPAAARIVGLDWPLASDVLAPALYASPEERRDFVEELRRAGTVDDLETRFRRSDGEAIWVALSSRLIVYQGREVAVTGLVDLTVRKRREAELRQAQETLEDAIKSLSEGFALYDPEDRLVLRNKQFLACNHMSADLFRPGRSWLEITRDRLARGQFPNAVGREDDWLSERFLKRGNIDVDEFPVSNGRWYEHSHRRTRQGGLVLTWREITERKEMQQALEESEAWVRRILEAAPAAITASDADDGRVIFETPATRALFRRGDDETIDDGAELYDDPRIRERGIRHLRRGGSIDNVEVEFRRRDDSRFRAAVSARLIDLDDEEVVVAIASDLSDRIALEEELAEQREALYQNEKLSALGQLLASVAHELNNPLSVLVGQALLLEETTRDAAIGRRADRIGVAADRCARIVRTFLAMARRQPNERVPSDPNEMLETALEVTGYALRGADVEIDLALAAALPPVLVDPDQVTQVFTNLIVNAEEALRRREAGRRLAIRSSHDAATGEIVVTVEDNGPGVPAEIRRRMFEPFFTTKEDGEGTGIGLALCHRVLEAHGGRIELAEGRAGGARFTVWLPADHALVQTLTDETPSIEDGEEATAADGHAILIDDDEPEVIEVLREILTADGHRVTAAGGGREVLARIAEARFDLVLSDVRMPDMDGPALHRVLITDDPELEGRLAFLNGDTLSAEIRDFLAEVGRPHIEKPFLPQDVRDLVRDMLAEGENEA